MVEGYAKLGRMELQRVLSYVNLLYRLYRSRLRARKEAAVTSPPDPYRPEPIAAVNTSCR